MIATPLPLAGGHGAPSLVVVAVVALVVVRGVGFGEALGDAGFEPLFRVERGEGLGE